MTRAGHINSCPITDDIACAGKTVTQMPCGVRAKVDGGKFNDCFRLLIIAPGKGAVIVRCSTPIAAAGAPLPPPRDGRFSAVWPYRGCSDRGWVRRFHLKGAGRGDRRCAV